MMERRLAEVSQYFCTTDTDTGNQTEASSVRLSEDLRGSVGTW